MCSAVEALNPVGNGGSHPDSTEDGLERLTSLLEESRAAQEEQDLAHILGERLSQQVIDAALDCAHHCVRCVNTCCESFPTPGTALRCCSRSSNGNTANA